MELVRRRGAGWGYLSTDCEKHQNASSHEYCSQYVSGAVNGMLHVAKNFDMRGAWEVFFFFFKIA
eukprot:4005451-Pyramimonas_sp.AAC.1